MTFEKTRDQDRDLGTCSSICIKRSIKRKCRTGSYQYYEHKLGLCQVSGISSSHYMFT